MFCMLDSMTRKRSDSQEICYVMLSVGGMSVMGTCIRHGNSALDSFCFLPFCA